MTHLGTQLSALADDRLDAVARERALCHVAACPACAEELRATRAARRALADAGDVPIAPDLAARLLALGAAGGPAGRASCSPLGVPAGSRPARLGGPLLALPAIHPGTGAPRGERLGDLGGRRLSVRSAALVTTGALAVGLFVLGDEPLVLPDSHPAADLALLAAAGPAAAAPVSSPVGGGPGAAVDAAWLDALPAGYAVVASSADESRARTDLDGPAGPVVVVRERGRLNESVLSRLAPTTIGPHEVYVLSDAPWHVVWQSGDAVVGVVAARRSAAAEEVVAAHPVRAFDGGVGARISRGWAAVVGAWGP